MDLTKLSYVKDHFDEKFVTSPEVYDLLKETFPEFEAAGYLGGSIRHDSFKWLAGAQIGSQREVYGSVGKQAMEVAQAGHHILKGTYLAYLSRRRSAERSFCLRRGIRRCARPRRAGGAMSYGIPRVCSTASISRVSGSSRRLI